MEETVGYSSSYRPDRMRFTRNNARSIVTTIYNRIAVDVSNVHIEHVRLDDNGRYLEAINSGLNQCLTVQANLDQTGRAFIQDVVQSMFDDGCVAIVPVDTTIDPTKSTSYEIETMRTIDGKVKTVENADYAEWNGNIWTMHGGVIYDISEEEGKSEHMVRFKTQVLPISANPTQIVREQKELEEMTMKELREQINVLKTQYVDTNKLEAELYQRVTVPMASLVFALVGVPLGLQPTRNSSSTGFAISVIIIFVYYALMTMGNALARSGVVAPMLAVWLPNLIGLAAGAYLVRRASR